jgi:molecular chaperone GrpE
MNQQHEFEPDTVEPGADAPAEAPAEATAPDAAELEQLRAQLAELKDEVLRARAETDNVRKRGQREVEAAHKYGQERLVQELLPVRDSLELGLAAAQSATEVESLRQGFELTVKMLGDFCDKLGIRKLEPVGEPFNPELHQAMSLEDSTATPPGHVIRVLQSGYLLNDRLLRPALVVVARDAGGA